MGVFLSILHSELIVFSCIRQFRYECSPNDFSARSGTDIHKGVNLIIQHFRWHSGAWSASNRGPFANRTYCEVIYINMDGACIIVTYWSRLVSEGFRSKSVDSTLENENRNCIATLCAVQLLIGNTTKWISFFNSHLNSFSIQAHKDGNRVCPKKLPQQVKYSALKNWNSNLTNLIYQSRYLVLIPRLTVF